MYVSPNFKTKKDLKEAVAKGDRVTVFQPGFGTAPFNGSGAVEGPHYPEPNKWYATVTIVEGLVTKVS